MIIIFLFTLALGLAPQQIIYPVVNEVIQIPLSEYFATNDKITEVTTDPVQTAINFNLNEFQATMPPQLLDNAALNIVKAKVYRNVNDKRNLGLYAYLDNRANGFNLVSTSQNQLKFDNIYSITNLGEGEKCWDIEYVDQQRIAIACLLTENQVQKTSLYIVNTQSQTQIRFTFENTIIYTEEKLKLQIYRESADKYILYTAQIGTIKPNSFIDQFSYEADTIIKLNSITQETLNGLYLRQSTFQLVDFVIGRESIILLDHDQLETYLYRLNFPNQLIIFNDPYPIALSGLAHIDTTLQLISGQQSEIISIISGTQQFKIINDLIYPSNGEMQFNFDANTQTAVTNNYYVTLQNNKIQALNLNSKQHVKTQNLEQVVSLVADSYKDQILIFKLDSVQIIQIQDQNVIISSDQAVQSTFKINAKWSGKQSTYTYRIDPKIATDQEVYATVTSLPDASQVFISKVSNGLYIKYDVCSGPDKKIGIEANNILSLKSQNYIANNLAIFPSNIGFHSIAIDQNGKQIVYSNNVVDFGLYYSICDFTALPIKCTNTQTLITTSDTAFTNDLFQYQLAKQNDIVFGIIQLNGYRLVIYTNNVQTNLLDFDQGNPNSQIEQFVISKTAVIILTKGGIVAVSLKSKTVIYRFDQTLLNSLGYAEQLNPIQFSYNPYLSDTFVIVNSNGDLIVGNYITDFYLQYVSKIPIDQKYKTKISISSATIMIIQYSQDSNLFREYNQLTSNPIKNEDITYYGIIYESSIDYKTGIISLNSLEKGLLTIKPNVYSRDKLFRIYETFETYSNPQITPAANGNIYLTSIVNQNRLRVIEYLADTVLVQYTLKKNLPYTTQLSNGLLLYNDFMNYSWRIKQLLDIEVHQNYIVPDTLTEFKINALQGNSVKQLVSLPQNMFTGQIYNYDVQCIQCSNPNFIELIQYLEVADRLDIKPDFISCQKDGTNTKLCLYEKGVEFYNQKGEKSTIELPVIPKSITKNEILQYYFVQTDNQPILISNNPVSKILELNAAAGPFLYSSKIIFYNNHLLSANAVYKVTIDTNTWNYNKIQDFQYLDIAYDKTNKRLLSIQGDQYLTIQHCDLDAAEFAISDLVRIDVTTILQNTKLITPLAFTKIISEGEKLYLFTKDKFGIKIHLSYPQGVQFIVVENIYPALNLVGSLESAVIIGKQLVQMIKGTDSNYLCLFSDDILTQNYNENPTLVIQVGKVFDFRTLYVDNNQIYYKSEKEKLNSLKVNKNLSLLIDKNDEKVLVTQDVTVYARDQSTEYGFVKVELNAVPKKSSNEGTSPWVYIGIALGVVALAGIGFGVYKWRIQRKQHVLLD